MSVSVNATVRSIEPDPDRPHCVRISFLSNYHYDVAGTVLDTSAHGYMLIYSQFPIHVDETDAGDIFVSTFEPSNNKTRIEFDLFFNVDGTDYGNHDFEYNFFDLERYATGAVEMWITYYPETGGIGFHNCDALNEHPVVEADYQCSLRIRYNDPYTSQSSQYGHKTIEKPMNLLWYVGSNSKTNNIRLGNISDDRNSCVCTVYNFNNPIFASGQAWLDYCKEQV